MADSRYMTVKLRLPRNLVKSLDRVARRKGVKRSRLIAVSYTHLTLPTN